MSGSAHTPFRGTYMPVATEVRISQSIESYVPAVVVPEHEPLHWLDTLAQCPVAQSVSVVQGHAPPADLTFT